MKKEKIDLENEKKNKKRGGGKILLAVAAILIFLSLSFGAGFLTSRLTLDKDIETIDYILKMYRQHYYDEEENVVGIFSDALLDDYSRYLTPEENAAQNASYAGSRYGIGCTVVQTRTDDGYEVTVKEVFGNSPSQKAGFRFGDKIVAMRKNATDEKTMINSLSDYSSFLSEIPDFVEFTVTLKRGDEEKEVSIAKKNFTQTFVKYFDRGGEYGFFEEDGKFVFDRVGDNEEYPMEETDGDVAVIKYSSFSGTGGGLSGSAVQFEKAMKKFKEDNKRDIIIDLRGNGGGMINLMNEIVRHYVDARKGEKVKTIVARDKYKKEEIFYSAGSLYSDYGFENIIMLVDRQSASATEAFVGAVLDYDEKSIARVVVSGGRSYGKGIMQKTFTRVQGDALRLTTAKLFWPKSDVCIHGVGITTATDGRVLNEAGSGSAFYDALSLCR